MSLTDAGANQALDGIAGPFTVSIHTGAPGDSGAANEVTGGSYARQTITLAAAAARARSMTDDPVFAIPAGVTVSHYAVWSGGVAKGVGALPSTQTFTEAGNLTLTSGTISIT
ncbi:MAG TPA: hypothetical protein VK999_07990 [Methylotenera sp.]|nr:hypothetical protein [Methylotenera sp.]